MPASSPVPSRVPGALYCMPSGNTLLWRSNLYTPTTSLRPCDPLWRFTPPAYVDGSWYPLASTAESLLGEAASHTGGFSIILVPSTTDLLSGVICSPCGCSGPHTCPRREPPYDGTYRDHLKLYTSPFPWQGRSYLQRQPKHHKTTHGFPSYASDGPDGR